jgi:hypothetical protein
MKLNQAYYLQAKGVSHEYRNKPNLKLASISNVINTGPNSSISLNKKELVVNFKESYPSAHVIEPDPSLFENCSSSRNLIDGIVTLKHQIACKPNKRGVGIDSSIIANRRDNDLNMNGGSGSSISSDNLNEIAELESFTENEQCKFEPGCDDFSTNKVQEKNNNKRLMKTEAANSDYSSLQFCSRRERHPRHHFSPPSSNSDCLLSQQYFIYLILCIIIIGSSLGFYYIFVTFSLKIDSLEKRLSQRINIMQVITSADYYSSNGRTLGAHNFRFLYPDDEEYEDYSEESVDSRIDATENKEENQVHLNQYNEKETNKTEKSSSSRVLASAFSFLEDGAEYFLLRRLNKTMFIMFPVLRKLPVIYLLIVKIICFVILGK